MRRAWRRAAGLAGLVLSMAVCGGLACRPATPRVDRIILISIDTLRADHLGAYGYTRPTSPAIDALAGRGTLFADVTSPSPWTLPAHASLFTGLYPSRHGVKDLDRRLAPELPTLASTLARAGWLTAAVVNAEHLSRRFGLDRGFQLFSYIPESVAARSPTTGVVDQALAWVRQHRDRPLFLFLHSYDVHSDYASLPAWEGRFVRPYRGRADGTTAQLLAFRDGKVPLTPADAPHLIDLYDASIRQVDEEVGRLLGALRADGLADGSLIVFLSDHGEEFFEHGGVLHGRTQFQELVRVPLIVSGPGVPAGRRIATPVSLLDLMPTLLSQAGVAPPASLDGEDLGPLLSGAAAPRLEGRHLFGEADHNNEQLDVTRMVRRNQLALHYNRVTGAIRLHDLSADPHEQHDLSTTRPDLVRELRRPLDRFLTLRPASGVPVTLSPAEIERLRSLGYIR